MLVLAQAGKAATATFLLLCLAEAAATWTINPLHHLPFPTTFSVKKKNLPLSRSKGSRFLSQACKCLSVLRLAELQISVYWLNVNTSKEEFQRFTEQSSLETISGDQLAQTLLKPEAASQLDHVAYIPPSQGLSLSKRGGSRTSLDNVFQPLSTLTVKWPWQLSHDQLTKIRLFWWHWNSDSTWHYTINTFKDLSFKKKISHFF